MFTAIHPKLPMRNKSITRDFYLQQLQFKDIGREDFGGYLIIQKDAIELHFFEFNELSINENYGQVYIRTNNIDNLYQEFINRKVEIHPHGLLQLKPWGQKEFSLLDPDNNLLTFGEALE